MLSEKDINTAAESVSKGGVVIIPTDTIYGFSCDPRNDQAIRRIRKIKERDNKPFIVLDSSLERIKGQYFRSDVFINETIDVMISEKLWPGKITIIADKNKDLKFSFLQDIKKIGVRFTSNEVIRTICTCIGYGIVSTSINISGGEQLTEIDQIRSEWSSKADFILEGFSTGNTASTIIELFSEEKNYKFLRIQDQESKEIIERVLSGRASSCRS